MTPLSTVLALVLAAQPGLPAALAREAAVALHAAVRDVSREEKVDVDPSLVVAIVRTESMFDARACANDRYGGSARGLMQVRVPAPSRCGDGQRPELYDARKNAREGVRILVALLRRARDTRKALHDYAGGSWVYADRVMATAGRIRR